MKLKFNLTKQELDNIACNSDATGIEGKPESVYFPESINELVSIVKQTPNIVIRGGGTGLAGGCIPLNDAVIDLTKLNKILKIDKIRKTVEIEAGVILDDLQFQLEKHGLEFPVQPSSHSICTIGGMIATNAVGSRGMKYGNTQNWVEELEIIDSRGEIKKITKVDISDYAGMEGITGIIIRARLKLIEKKKRTASLLKFDDLDEMIEIIKKLKLEKDVSMIEFFDKKISNFLELQEGYYLIVEYESDRGSLKNQDYFKIIMMRDFIYPSLAKQGYVKLEDPQVYSSRLKEFLLFLEQEDIPVFGHLGSGIIHAGFKLNEDEKIKKLLNKTRKIHGKISGEHGIGFVKKEFLDETEKKLIRKVKERLDSMNKFNKNKVIDYKENDLSESQLDNVLNEVKKAEQEENSGEKNVN